MNTVEVETTAAKEEIENSKKIAIRFLNECDFSSDTLAFIFMGFLDENPGTPCVAMVDKNGKEYLGLAPREFLREFCQGVLRALDENPATDPIMQ